VVCDRYRNAVKKPSTFSERILKIFEDLAGIICRKSGKFSKIAQKKWILF
jgi:hypothetical protein